MIVIDMIQVLKDGSYFVDKQKMRKVEGTSRSYQTIIDTDVMCDFFHLSKEY